MATTKARGGKRAPPISADAAAALDRIAARYRGKDASRLVEYLEAKASEPQEPRVSEVVRAAIKESGLSLNDLAKKADVSVASLSRFVNEQAGLTMVTLDRLAPELGLVMTRRPKK